ncbi:MAG: DUF2961 domain-containing protein [Planctomycetes bacterium]|nr:DUF2961 domain-containing protein [Planctomycetota bacterium]
MVHSTTNAHVGMLGREVVTLLLSVLGAMALAYERPRPGDPATLLDWRWLARPLACERRISNDPWGKRKLEPAEGGGFILLDVPGPGVLDHLWTPSSAGALPIIEADGKPQERPPEPLAFEGGGMRHIVAPVAFQNRLRIIAAKPQYAHFASCRVFPKGTPVAAPDAAKLKSAAEAWRKSGFGLNEGKPFVERPFVLPARGRAVAFEQKGSGEVIALEFHMNPALTGTLREVVVEFTYDGAAAPALRMPLTDLAGVPHPWPCGRWDRYSGDLAAGLRYPWYLNRPRVHFPEATVHFNLPIPFANGLKIELVNRSGLTQFVGHTRAVILPLSGDEAGRCGRLCGTRLIAPIRPAAEPQPLISLPGPGHVVGLGLFLTGNAAWPAAVHESFASLAVDSREPILGHGILPLWFQGIYGGPITGLPIWNHPRLEEGYAGVMRHFLTDPVAFEREAAFGFTPGPKAEGAPAQGTVLALWYRFGPKPYEAPALPDRAEQLPHSVFGDERPPPTWAAEAEDLAPLATAHETELRVVEDTEHNYHPNGGKYLHIVADKPGGYVDFAVRLPASRYVSVAVYPLWGPGRGTFELDVLSRAEAREGPRFPQGDAFIQGRILGSVPVKAPVFTGHALDLRRDPGCHHTPPILNPAPDQRGVIRLICQAKPLDSNSHLLKLDRLRMDTPPATAPGWQEFKGAPEPRASGGLAASVPRYGRPEWSGWGALVLESPPGGKAIVTALAAAPSPSPSGRGPTSPPSPSGRGPTSPPSPSGRGRGEGAGARADAPQPTLSHRERGCLVIKGCLGPDQGRWQARVAGEGAPVDLAPGKDAAAVLEWTLPAGKLPLPGPVAIEFTCTASGKGAAQLALDCWRAQ